MSPSTTPPDRARLPLHHPDLAQDWTVALLALVLVVVVVVRGVPL